MATLNTTNIKHGSSSSNNIVLASDGKVTFPQNTGNILQVVQLNLDGGISTTSTTFTDATGLTQDITTTGSNKVLVEVQIFVSNSGEHYYTFLKLLRGSTEIQRNVRMQDTAAAGSSGGLVTMTVLDSPGAGTHTYKVQFKSENSSKTAKIGIGGSAGSTSDDMPDSIIRLMEVAA